MIPRVSSMFPLVYSLWYHLIVRLVPTHLLSGNSSWLQVLFVVALTTAFHYVISWLIIRGVAIQVLFQNLIWIERSWKTCDSSHLLAFRAATKHRPHLWLWHKLIALVLSLFILMRSHHLFVTVHFVQLIWLRLLKDYSCPALFIWYLGLSLFHLGLIVGLSVHISLRLLVYDSFISG